MKRIEGVLSPVVTPFSKDYSPDAERFVRHCNWLLKSGCAGLAVFGTNSEANSMSVSEKRHLLEALVAGGVPASALMPGTGHCALSDSIEMTRAAVELGCAGVLMLPPFYYKGVPDEGLYRNFAEVIERVGDERLQLYLYHIPPVAQVAITLGLIERLLTKYPGIVAGVKDSSGDWSNTKAMLDASPRAASTCSPAARCSCSTTCATAARAASPPPATSTPAPIANVYRNWRSADADKLQAGITATRKIVQKQPMIPALKAAVAHFGNDPQWKTCRPPLIELTASSGKRADHRTEGRRLLHARAVREDRAGHRRRARHRPRRRRGAAEVGLRVLAPGPGDGARSTYDLDRPRRHPEAGRLARRDPRPGQQRRRAERGRASTHYTEEQRTRILRVNLERRSS